MYSNRKDRKMGSFLMALKTRGARLGFPLLLLFALVLGTAYSAQAGTFYCVKTYGGIIDGFNAQTYSDLTSGNNTLGIDGNCLIKNWPQTNTVGGFPVTNINFYFPGGADYYIIFDNVYYTGNMSCNDPTNSNFWIYWTPGGYTDISSKCQAQMVPADAVIKQNPPAQTKATIGVPFTYTITAPYLGQIDPTTGTTFDYIKTYDDYQISNLVITDDLTENNTAALSYVTNHAYMVDGSGNRTPLNGGNPLVLGASSTWLSAHPVSATQPRLSDNTKHLIFSYENNPALVTGVPAGYHIEIDLTVVLENDATINYPNETFTNTVNMWFDKIITYTRSDGTTGTTPVANLQAWPTTTPPMTIAGPNLVVTKTSTATNLNVGSTAPFKIDVQNNGSSTAWDAELTDDIPAGMCSNPTTSFTAGLYAADGTTLVANLVQGTDYSLTWTGGTAAACQLILTMLDTSVNQIGSNQHLIITYGAQLDSGTSPGQKFTNIAGATQWYGAKSIYTDRHLYGPNTLTTGTPGTLDYQDTWTITSTTQGYFFLKSVADLTTGVSEAGNVPISAFPGDRLRYTLQIQNFQVPELDNITIIDDLGLNTSGAFVPGISIYSSNLPGTATVTPCNSCGTGGAPKITITGLNLAGNTQYQIQFEVTLASAPPLSNGTIVYNQASLTGTDTQTPPVTWSGVSDDPFKGGGPAQLSSSGDKTPVTIQTPGALSKTNPTPATATIGQQFAYTITVPATATSVPLYDVQILDTLPANLSFVSAQAVVSGGGTWNLTNIGTATNLILHDPLNTGIDIPAGSQAVIQVTVALQNTATNISGVTFTNTASYTYDKINGDSMTQATGGAGTTSNMTVVEPHLTATKAVSYASPAGQAITVPAKVGDVLQYTVTVTNNGGSEAYDADVMDFLPQNGSLVAGSAAAQINGSPVGGFIATPTTLASGSVDWGNQNGDNNLDIPVNGTLVLTYQVQVQWVDGTLINNTIYAAWTSRDGDVTGERTGEGCPNWTSPNNYCSGPVTATPVPTLDPTTLAKSVVSDSWTTAPSTSTDSTLRIGDTVVYSLALTLREGVTQNVVVTDTLPTGLAFDSVVSITPASGSSNIIYTVASQPAPGATGTLTWNLANISNAIDNNAANNTLIIQYRAKVVKNTLTQLPTTQTLTNNATVNYAINGVAAAPKTSSSTINVWQPMLTVSKSAVPAGGGTVITSSELITYTVNITNSGTAPAYNTVLTDTLPVGLRQNGVTITSITLVNAGTVLPILASPYFSYNDATGVATWNFDVSGAPDLYAIPPGETLRVVYQVTADSGLGAGMTLNNLAQVTTYYSFDSQDVPTNSTVTNRQVYGPTSTATIQLTTASATALSKNALVTTAAVGQPFTYEIRIPATPQPTAMYDVRVLDDISLTKTGVTMSYVSSSAHLASNAKSWATLTNSGTATNFILQDTTSGGLDIPANDQLVVDVTVVLNNDTTNNTINKQFSNTADYTYDSINNNTSTQANGAPGASGAVTIVGPALTMQKSGPSTMSTLAPGTFTLNVQNTGGSTAWQTTLTDILPNGATGGMCGSAPTNVTARIYQSDGTTAVSAPLVSGTDFTVSFAGAPTCTLTVAMKSSATGIPPTDRLIATYSAALDPNTAGSITLTNIAGATQWLSADPAVTAPGNIQTFTGALTNGTQGVVDNQDAFTVTTQAPSLTFTKTVTDVTTGQSGANARPGDLLQYTLTIQNAGALGASNFSLTDELDKLNNPAMFVPGTLKLIAVPAGANTSLTSTIGGSKGTGLVSISNLSVAPQGQTGDTLVIQFQITLLPVINSGSLVLNQAQIGSSTLPTQLSDDPSITGTTNPTQTLITSAPAFRVLKTVQDITSGTSIVMAGDTLRYTITVKNIGTENAVGVTLRDQIPTYTTYVANSTKLNGTGVPDTSGVSALQNGMLIKSPANPTAGAMPANAGTTTTNVATITFDVQVSKNVVNGTIISNQGLVDGSGTNSGPFTEQPSDNPATPVVNDPTSVVVGNLPLVYALKTVQLAVDVNGNGSVDPGDTLQYTITMTNSSATPATGVVLTDAIPADTTYVSNSVRMNAVAVTDPGPGVSPLDNGMGAVSSGLTPPSPPSSGGTLAAGGTGIVTFKVTVNSGVASGTVISNQGSVATTQLPALLTDSDGNPTNGYQPTVITVGDVQQLSITKSVVAVGGGVALPGSVLEYTIQATNIGTVPATNVVITDNLTSLSAQASYVANSATMNGSANGVSFTSPVITANYSAVYGTLAPGSSVTVRFDVKLNNNVTGTITNTAQVNWNSPAQTASASVTAPIGGLPGTASLNGSVWQDLDFNNTLGNGDLPLAGWAVDLYQNGQLLGTVSTAPDGSYHIYNVTPNFGTTMPPYEIRFRAQGAGSNTAMLGWASGPYSSLNGAAVTYSMQRISNIVAASNDVLHDLNLPLTPNGVVYNSITRAPIAGATLNLVQASSKTPLATSCFNDPAQQGQVTLSSGYYKFDLNFSDSSCPSGGDYLIQVTPPATGYTAGVSKLIPLPLAYKTATFSVPNCPGNSSMDAVLSTPSYCEAQASSVAPKTGSGAYYLLLTLEPNTTLPEASQIYNNHIPIDPTLNTAIEITKTSALVNVTRAQLVPYTITFMNTLGVALQDLSVLDTFPPGFKYVAGSGRVDGQKIEPVMTTKQQLSWNVSQLTSKSSHTIKLLLIVGSGVSEGEYVNRAQVINNVTRGAVSGIASATVRLTPDPNFDCTDIIGKVFDDANADGYPDQDEKGLGGVRIVSARGLIATTDKYGRFHITCAAVPNEDRGSNFILKLDDRTLPTGYRITTENPLVHRLTRGKANKFNFGATLHRVVRLDLADGVFEPGSTEMREQWKPRIETLLSELRKAPSILRISYLADVEDPKVVKARAEAVKREIADRWKQGSYELTIETEIFWRRGGPPDRRPVANDGQ